MRSILSTRLLMKRAFDPSLFRDFLTLSHRLNIKEVSLSKNTILLVLFAVGLSRMLCSIQSMS